MPCLLVAAAPLVFERNLCAIGQAFERLQEIHALILHDESENIPAFLAAEAFEDLKVWIDVEAWRFLFVKRAERHEIRAGAFQGKVSANNIYDVIGSANLFAGSIRDQAGHAIEALKL